MLVNRLKSLARPGRLERPTCGFVVRRSIHLSYGRTLIIPDTYNPNRFLTLTAYDCSCNRFIQNFNCSLCMDVFLPFSSLSVNFRFIAIFQTLPLFSDTHLDSEFPT